MGPTAFTLSLDSSPRPSRASSAHLFLVLGCDRLLAAPLRLSLASVEQLAIGRARSDQIEVERGAEGTARLGVPDPRMSHDHARLQRAMGRWLLLDAGSKNGTWLDGVSIDQQALSDGAFFAAGHTLFRLRTALEPAPDALAPPDAPPGLRTLLPHLHAELERLRAIAA